MLSFHSNHSNYHKKSSIRTSFTRVRTHYGTAELGKLEENYLFKMLQWNIQPENFRRIAEYWMDKESDERTTEQNDHSNLYQTRI